MAFDRGTIACAAASHIVSCETRAKALVGGCAPLLLRDGTGAKLDSHTGQEAEDMQEDFVGQIRCCFHIRLSYGFLFLALATVERRRMGLWPRGPRFACMSAASSGDWFLFLNPKKTKSRCVGPVAVQALYAWNPRQRPKRQGYLLFPSLAWQME
jgi:hypothetical protein